MTIIPNTAENRMSEKEENQGVAMVQLKSKPQPD